jgi:hypothetical protein
MKQMDQQRADLDLEFPDWSGHLPVPYFSETVDAMDLRSEAMLPLVKAHEGYLERWRADKIDVPFRI